FPSALHCGRGWYAPADVRERLRALADELGFAHKGMHDLGSSWYGPAGDLLRAVELARDFALHIFKQFEQSGDGGEWPDWWQGVSTLYGGELALNKLFEPSTLRVDDAFDRPSTNGPALGAQAPHHVHCLHGREHFSKLDMHEGLYANRLTPALTESIPDYCLAMYVRGARYKTEFEAGRHRPLAAARLIDADAPTQLVRRLQPARHGGKRDREKRIFVSTASFADPELPLTIASALELAARPERLRFGIWAKFDRKARRDLNEFERDHRVRIDDAGSRRNRGRAWARNRASSLYKDEEYILQIDPRSRFAEAWDTRFIDMLDSLDDARALLTTYPPSYHVRPDGRVELDQTDAVQRVTLVTLNADLTADHAREPAPSTSMPGQSFFVTTRLIFARGAFLGHVPADPQIHSGGEDISIALRAYTNGYNLYYPNENLIWQDNTSPNLNRNEGSPCRLRDLLVGDPRQLGDYGLGAIRSRTDYERYAGIEFATGAGATGASDAQPTWS
ncbi:MAG: GlcNAc-transferase family protein, partial [Gaiellaceae bacterium]